MGRVRYGDAILAKVQAQRSEPVAEGRRTLKQIVAEDVRRPVAVQASGAAVVGIDPGPAESAFVLLVGGNIVEYANQDNEVLLDALRNGWPINTYSPCYVAIEQIVSYNQVVSNSTIETCRQSGRLCEAARMHSWVILLPRHDILRHLGCRKTRGEKRGADARVRAALELRYGKRAVRGGHIWAALAVATAANDRTDAYLRTASA